MGDTGIQICSKAAGSQPAKVGGASPTTKKRKNLLKLWQEFLRKSRKDLSAASPQHHAVRQSASLQQPGK